MLVLWKNWQTTTVSCSRRSTRGNHWRSATSKTCPSWRYDNPNAQYVYSATVSPAKKKELGCTRHAYYISSNMVFGCGRIIREVGVGGVVVEVLGRSVGNRTWDEKVCWLWKLECLRLCAGYKQHFSCKAFTATLPVFSCTSVVRWKFLVWHGQRFPKNLSIN